MQTNKFYEGLEAVVYIAVHAGADAVSSKDICAAQGSLPRHLEPVMQALVKHGVLKGTKGPKGGYTLAREKRKITAGEVYRAFLVDKKEDKPSEIKRKVINPLDKEVKAAMLDKLDSVTLEDLCKGFIPGKSKADVFNI